MKFRAKYQYRISVREGGEYFDVGACVSIFIAKLIAKHHVDDALLRNTVHVFDDWNEGKSIGYAGFGGDGEPYWRDANS